MIFYIVLIVIVSVSFANEIKNKHLRREYEIELNKKSNDLLTKGTSIEDCIRDCFDCSETNIFLTFEVYSIHDCFEYGDCVNCVNHCLETYNLDEIVESNTMLYTRNKCFIRGL